MASVWISPVGIDRNTLTRLASTYGLKDWSVLSTTEPALKLSTALRTLNGQGDQVGDSYLSRDRQKNNGRSNSMLVLLCDAADSEDTVPSLCFITARSCCLAVTSKAMGRLSSTMPIPDTFLVVEWVYNADSNHEP
jgi:hypothetical protein